MKRAICIIMFSSSLLFSQQRYLVSPDNEVTPIKNGENTIDVARVLGLKWQATTNCYISSIPVDPPFDMLGIGSWHKDVMAQSYIAPFRGTIDTIFWQIGFRGDSADSFVNIRIFKSNISPGTGPGYPPYSDYSCQPWGYYRDTFDYDNGITPFKEEATDTAWVSTYYDPLTKTFDPLGEEIWGLGGQPVKFHTNAINKISLLDVLGYKPVVERGEQFFITMQVLSPNRHIESGDVTYFDAVSVPKYGQECPPRVWKFYEHERVTCLFDSISGNSPGWKVRGSFANDTSALMLYAWWFTVTPVGLNPSIFDNSIVISDSVTVNFSTCGINYSEDSTIKLKLLYKYETGEEGYIILSQFDSTFTATVPSPEVSTTVSFDFYASSATDTIKIPIGTVTGIGGLSQHGYTADPNAPFEWRDIRTTGSKVINWFTRNGVDSAMTLDEGTAGPFDLGAPMRFFNDYVRYVWVGVNGIISFSNSPVDTVYLTRVSGNYENWSVPSLSANTPKKFIAPYFDNHHIEPNGGVYVQQEGAKFIIEWYSLNSSWNSLTFELILDQSDNTITMLYADIESDFYAENGLVGMQGDSSNWYLYNPRKTFSARRPVDQQAIIFTLDFTVVLNWGWNLRSIPAKMIEKRKSILFPDAISEAYGFAFGYYKLDSITSGKGFWIKNKKNGYVNIEGDLLMVDTVNVRKGWNLIGSVALPIPVSSIIYIPDNIIESNYFGGIPYENQDMIYPGLAYWVKVRDNGKIVLRYDGNSIQSLKK